MKTDVQVAVVGATGSVGSEVLIVLDAAPWRPSRVVPFARRSTKIPFVDYGAEQLPVEDMTFANLSEFSVVIVAAPAEAAREIVQETVKQGVMVVDLSGVSSLDGVTPLVIPWVNPEGLKNIGPNGVLAVPGAPATVIASVVAPLQRAGLVTSVGACVMVPASHWGRDGVDELSRQVVALFNSATPSRKVFPKGLAFDLVSEVGQRLDSGATVGELMAETQLKSVLYEDCPVSVNLVGVPVFSGLSALIEVNCPKTPNVEVVIRMLADGGVIVGGDDSVSVGSSPRSVEGEPFVHVSRVRIDDNKISIWASMDNLRAAATVAVANAGALLRRS